MKVADALRVASDRLRKAGVEEAELNGELLLSSVLGVDRMHLTVHSGAPVTERQQHSFEVVLGRRERREPLQYILGWTEFMGLRFEVDPSVLIPRPETELLVETAEQVLATRPPDERSVLDVGTGSGNIALAIARRVSDSRVLAIDVSAGALKIAGRNRKRLGISSVQFLEADIDSFHSDKKFDLLVSNPPYVSRDEFDSLQPEITRFEPRIATTDEGDGFHYLALLLDRSRSLVKPGCSMLIEIGFGQSQTAIALAKERGMNGVQVRDDLAGVPRLLSVIVPE